MEVSGRVTTADSRVTSSYGRIGALRLLGAVTDRSAIVLGLLIHGLLHMEGVVVYAAHPDDVHA